MWDMRSYRRDIVLHNIINLWAPLHCRGAPGTFHSGHGRGSAPEKNLEKISKKYPKIPKNSQKYPKIPKSTQKYPKIPQTQNSTYFENKRDSLSRFWAMNQEPGEPLPCPVPSPGSIGSLARSESPWARSAYLWH